MALFQSKEVEKVGPVRSARTYFVEMVREYGAWYAHVGGSSEALLLIARYGLNDLNQFFHDKPYWRDQVRWKNVGKEHSMYTSTSALRKLVKTNIPFSIQPWIFQQIDKNNLEPASSAAQEIIVNFSFPIFEAKWRYDASENLYKRWMGGAIHKDAETGEQLTARNVLVQYVKMSLVFPPKKEEEGLLNMQMVGEGEGVFFREGKAFAVTWKKGKSGERTKFYYENGGEVIFGSGTIWVEVVEKGRVVIKN